MNNTGSKKTSFFHLEVWFCLAYFFSYLTRQNYTAVLTEIIDDLGVEKSLASIAITGSLISYGFFQIISGVIGDRYKPEKIIFTGLAGSATINLLICIFPNIYLMNALWCVNGIFQSLIWPPLVRMIIETLGTEGYSRAVMRVTQSSYVATVVAYLAVPALILLFNWKSVFLIFGSMSLIFSVLWYFKTKKITLTKVGGKTEETPKKSALSVKTLIQIGIIPIVISTSIAGFLRDGITTWMPTYIKEVYSANTVTSILTGTIIPVSCAFCLELLNIIGRKMKTELKASAFFAFVSTTCATVLAFIFSKNPVFDVLLMSIITVSVHGINLMLVCNVPKRFSRFNKSSTLSGVLNSAVYVGAALSTFATAKIASASGWVTVIVVWIVLSAIAFSLCFFRRKKYAKTIEEFSL